MEINDWSDLSQLDDAPPKNTNLDAIGGLNAWSDLRQFDDDHDNEWFEAEEKHLAEQYGGNYLKVKYGDHGRVIYFCELCGAACDTKKILEVHCGGMKHLKKKDLFEKEGKPETLLGMKGPESRPPKPKQNFNSRRDSRDYNRRESRRDSRSRSRERRGPPVRRGRSRSRDRYSPRNRSMDREPFSFNPRGRINGGGPGDFRNDSFHTGSFGYPPTSFSSSYGNRDNQEPPGPPPGMMPKSPLNYGFGNEGRPSAMNFDGSSSRGPPSPTRRVFFGGSLPQGGFQGRSPITPSPPKFNKTAAPIQSELSMDKANLSKSPAGVLIQKLSECCVKSSDDADLALNVIASLVKSLKEYSKKSGENKIAELLMEAEFKVGTVKALKVGMKMLSSFADPSSKSQMNASSEAFFESMKQFQQDVGGGLSAAFNNSDRFL